MATHSWSPGFRAKVAPAVAAAELDRVREKNGSLTAPAVFEAAKPAKAPLHNEFIWDGPTAVRELGLIRARSIIRSVRIVEESKPDDAPRRVWVHIEPKADEKADSKTGEYLPITEVVQHVDLYERALTELQRKMDAAHEAFNELRRAAEGTADEKQKAAIALAVQGFGAVREALAILR